MTDDDEQSNDVVEDRKRLNEAVVEIIGEIFEGPDIIEEHNNIVDRKLRRVRR